MSRISPNKHQRLDGKSLRYRGLLVGLCGTIYLTWQSGNSQPPVARGADQASQAALSGAPVIAASDTWLDALWQADPDAVALLLAEGVAANGALDRRNTRPLHLLFFGAACQYGVSASGVLSTMEALLQAGAKVNESDQRGNTPLMLAAAECGPEVVERLLQAGADSYATNALGLTAFELTLSNASETGRVLTEAGFRLSQQQFSHYQALYYDEPAVLQQLSLADPGRP